MYKPLSRPPTPDWKYFLHICLYPYKTGEMWVTLVQAYCLVQCLRGVLGTEMVQKDSGLNSLPYVGSLVTSADFSKNDIRAVTFSSLSGAILLEVRLWRVSRSVMSEHAATCDQEHCTFTTSATADLTVFNNDGICSVKRRCFYLPWESISIVLDQIGINAFNQYQHANG